MIQYNLKRCPQCLFPSTKPDLHFNEQGVCYACRFTEYAKKIDWVSRKQEFLDKVQKHQSSSQYDCIIPVSGGKDSTYQVHLVTQEVKLNPLLVAFEPSCPTDIGKANLQNLVDTYNCDLIQLKKSPTYKKLAKVGFEVIGDHEWPNHVGIYTWPLQVALNYDIKLTFYGEGGGYIGLGRWDRITGEKHVTRSDVEQYIGMNGLRLSDVLEFDPTIDHKKIIPYQYPPLDKLKMLDIKAYQLGYYFYWDFQENIKLIKQYGWQPSPKITEGTFANWEDLDCGFMPIHQYMKFIKYGYARATDHASYEIRHGRMMKEEAVDLILQHDWKMPTEHFSEFLEFLDITEEQYFRVIDRFANPMLFKQDSRGKFIRKWDGNLILNEAWKKGLLSELKVKRTTHV